LAAAAGSRPHGSLTLASNADSGFTSNMTLARWQPRAATRPAVLAPTADAGTSLHSLPPTSSSSSRRHSAPLRARLARIRGRTRRCRAHSWVVSGVRTGRPASCHSCCRTRGSTSWPSMMHRARFGRSNHPASSRRAVVLPLPPSLQRRNSPARPELSPASADIAPNTRRRPRLSTVVPAFNDARCGDRSSRGANVSSLLVHGAS